MKISWTPKSLRAFKRLMRKNPNLKPPKDWEFSSFHRYVREGLVDVNSLS